MQQPATRRTIALATAAVLALTFALAACSSADPEREVVVPQTGPGTTAPGTSAPGTSAVPRSGTTQTSLPRPSTTPTTATGPTSSSPPTSFTPGPIEPLPDETVPDGPEDPTVPADDSTTTTEAEPEVMPSDFDLPSPTTSEA